MSKPNPIPNSNAQENKKAGAKPDDARVRQQPKGEVNGPRGPEPTRFGDWEKNGRCSDF